MCPWGRKSQTPSQVIVFRYLAESGLQLFPTRPSQCTLSINVILWRAELSVSTALPLSLTERWHQLIFYKQVLQIPVLLTLQHDFLFITSWFFTFMAPTLSDAHTILVALFPLLSFIMGGFNPMFSFTIKLSLLFPTLFFAKFCSARSSLFYKKLGDS